MAMRRLINDRNRLRTAIFNKCRKSLNAQRSLRLVTGLVGE